MLQPLPESTPEPLFAAHERSYAANRYVYPVISRRAGGLSIGVNLNLDKFCNFHCVYCQVDRTSSGEDASLDLTRLATELDEMLRLSVSSRLFDGPRFAHTPPQLRRLNDIAFSGDGEPTASAAFPQAVEVCAEARRRFRLDALKLVLITNASLFHHPRVSAALEVLDRNNGEIWAKLDAGSEEYYRRVNRSQVPWRQILANLRAAAAVRSLVIQTLLMRLHGAPPLPAEIISYCERLQEIIAAGGRIKLVQLHTLARPPAEAWVSALMAAELEAIAAEVHKRTGLPVATFP